MCVCVLISFLFIPVIFLIFQLFSEISKRRLKFFDVDRTSIKVFNCLISRHKLRCLYKELERNFNCLFMEVNAIYCVHHNFITLINVCGFLLSYVMVNYGNSCWHNVHAWLSWNIIYWQCSGGSICVTAHSRLMMRVSDTKDQGQ